MSKLEENLKHSGGVITIILIILEVSIIIGIGISLAFTIWVLSGTNGIPAANMLYQALLQGLSVQSNGEIAAELCTNAVSSLFLLFTLITAYPIFRSIRNGASPFSNQSTKRLKKVAITAFVCAIVNPIARAGFYATFATETGLSKMMNPDFIVLAILLFAVAVVFDYGAELQRQADEKL
ncbi:MAG: hypothetical protein RR954_06165 [Christensenellaceae bacterium]